MLLPFLFSTLFYSQIIIPKPLPCPYRADVVNMISGVFCCDSGMDMFGTLHIVQDGVVYEKENRVDGNFEIHLLDAPRVMFDRRQLKFRYGSSYASVRSKIVKYNKATSRWEIILDSPRPFSAFEVTFSGQILLFGTFAKPDPEHPCSQTILKKKDLEEGAQIETWETLGADPVSTIPYDSADRELAKVVEGLTSYNRTWIHQDSIIFYNDYTGRMGAYNLTTKSLKWVKTPWAGLTLEGLKAWEKDAKGKWDLQKAGQILIDALDVPPQGGIELCPDEISLKVAYWRVYSLSKTEETRKETIRNHESKPTVILPPPVSPDAPRGKIAIGTLDLEKGEISQDQFLDPPTGQAIWVNREGELVALDRILKPSRPEQSKNREKGKMAK